MNSKKIDKAIVLMDELKDFMEEFGRFYGRYEAVTPYNWEFESEFKLFLYNNFCMIELLFETDFIKGLYRKNADVEYCQITVATMKNFMDALVAKVDTTENRHVLNSRKYTRRLYNTLRNLYESTELGELFNEFYGIDISKIEVRGYILAEIFETGEMVVYQFDTGSIATVSNRFKDKYLSRYYDKIMKVLESNCMDEQDMVKDISSYENILMGRITRLGFQNKYENIREAILDCSKIFYSMRVKDFDAWVEKSGYTDMPYDPKLDIRADNVYRIGKFYGPMREG